MKRELTRQFLKRHPINSEAMEAILDAEEVLKKHRNDKSFPIDARRIAQNMGFEVKDVEDILEPYVGTIVSLPDRRVIKVRSSDSEERKRCTISHLIGHAWHFENHFKRRRHPFQKDGGFKYAQLVYFKARKYMPLEQYERYANVFAGFLLMPWDLLSKHYDDDGGITKVLTPTEVAFRFGVSEHAATSHLTGIAKLDAWFESSESREEEETVEYWINWDPPEAYRAA